MIFFCVLFGLSFLHFLKNFLTSEYNLLLLSSRLFPLCVCFLLVFFPVFHVFYVCACILCIFFVYICMYLYIYVCIYMCVYIIFFRTFGKSALSPLSNLFDIPVLSSIYAYPLSFYGSMCVFRTCVLYGIAISGTLCYTITCPVYNITNIYQKLICS